MTKGAPLLQRRPRDNESISFADPLYLMNQIFPRSFKPQSTQEKPYHGQL
jgi:hypothetical protein